MISILSFKEKAKNEFETYLADCLCTHVVGEHGYNIPMHTLARYKKTVCIELHNIDSLLFYRKFDGIQ